jgi:hypothetical protein
MYRSHERRTKITLCFTRLFSLFGWCTSRSSNWCWESESCFLCITADFVSKLLLWWMTSEIFRHSSVYISDNSSLHWLTKQVNTWNRVPLEHMKVCLSKNSLCLWNQKAHKIFARACHWTLFWPRLFLYTLSHLISLRWYWRPSTTRSYKRSLLFTLSGKLNQGDWDKHDLYQARRRW